MLNTPLPLKKPVFSYALGSFEHLKLDTLYDLGRAHRSHRWGRWFESNCHHHSEALVAQGLHSFAIHPGVYFPGVFFVGMNSS